MGVPGGSSLLAAAVSAATSGSRRTSGDSPSLRARSRGRVGSDDAGAAPRANSTVRAHNAGAQDRVGDVYPPTQTHSRAARQGRGCWLRRRHRSAVVHVTAAETLDVDSPLRCRISAGGPQRQDVRTRCGLGDGRRGAFVGTPGPFPTVKRWLDGAVVPVDNAATVPSAMPRTVWRCRSRRARRFAAALCARRRRVAGRELRPRPVGPSMYVHVAVGVSMMASAPAQVRCAPYKPAQICCEPEPWFGGWATPLCTALFQTPMHAGLASDWAMSCCRGS